MRRRTVLTTTGIALSFFLGGCTSNSDIESSYEPGDPVIIILRNDDENRVQFELRVEELESSNVTKNQYTVEGNSVTETSRVGKYGNEYLIQVSANGVEKETEMAFDTAGGPEILFEDEEIQINWLPVD
jgi:hypothetical protein